MITPQQSRSARAWLDWSRADLSRLSGVSSPAITEFETGRSNPGLDTMEKLFVTYAGAGIEFTPNGLEYNRDRLLWLDDYSALLDDIMLLRPKEALFMNADDAKSSPAIRKREQELQSSEISLRFVAPLTGRVGQAGVWRKAVIPGFQDVRVVYADRVAFWTPDRILLIINDYLASDYRRQFEEIWTHA